MSAAPPNPPPTGTQARVLRATLAEEIARRDDLQQQHLEMENEISEARKSAALLMNCKSASERVQRALVALEVAIKEAKDSVSRALTIHDTEVDIVNETRTITPVRQAWNGLTSQFEGLARQLEDSSAITEDHILTTSGQAKTYYFVANYTRGSLEALNSSLKALSASILSQSGCPTSILHLPEDVLRVVFQFAADAERMALRAEFTAPAVDFEKLEQMRRSIPKCPFALAAVCRPWRALALEMPALWSYLRAPTWVRNASSQDGRGVPYRGVGKSAYECSLRRAGSRGITLELVLYPFSLESSEFLMGLNPRLRLLKLHLVRPTNIPGWLPVCRHLSVYGVGQPLLLDGANNIQQIAFPALPYSLVGLTCIDIIPLFNRPLNSQIFTFRSDASYQTPSIEHLSEKLPTLRGLQLLLRDFPHRRPTPWAAPRTWGSLRLLAITSSALPYLAFGAREGLVLPSLIAVILFNLSASFKPTECEGIGSIFQLVTSLDIRHVSASATSSDLRVIINWMDGLEGITVHGLAVEKTVEALSKTPVKAITRLLINHSTFNGAGLNNYAALLQEDNIQLPQTSFIDCDNVATEVRQLFAPTP